jgi:hypothetical protein
MFLWAEKIFLISNMDLGLKEAQQIRYLTSSISAKNNRGKKLLN